MSFHEKMWLHNCPSLFKPLLYQRYVDDCFLIKPLNHVPLFLTILPNISFTSELEKDGKLPFLDVEIFRSSSKFSTSVYRKPTFTGLFTNFHRFIPLAYKCSLVSFLLHRIFNLCSTYENFHAQLVPKKIVYFCLSFIVRQLKADILMISRGNSIFLVLSCFFEVSKYISECWPR